MESTLHGCQCNQVCPKDLSLVLYYLFYIYVNDIYSTIHHSKHGMFADDLSIYKDVSTTADCTLLQLDLDSIVQWSKRWQLQLNCCKCEALNVSNKRSPLLYTYTISSQPLQWSSQCHYLGVLIDSHLRWGAHCRSIAQKSSRVLNLLRRSLFGCTKDVKSLTYRTVCSKTLFGICQCSVESPHSI